MDPRVRVHRAETTGEEALESLRRLRDRRICNLYVVNPDGVYLGGVPIQDVIAAEPDQTLESLLADAPIILTIVTDVVGFFSFLGIAAVLSGLL